MEVIPFVVPSYAQPVVHCLQRQVDILGRLEFHNRQAAVARHAQQIDYPTIARCKGRHLRVDVSRVEPRIDPRGVGLDHGLEPALRLGAIKGVASLRGEGMAVSLELANQLLQVAPVSFRELAAVVAQAEEHPPVVPARQLEPAKAQRHVARARWHPDPDGSGRQRANLFHCGSCQGETVLEFPPRR